MGKVSIGKVGHQDASIDIDILLRTRGLIQSNSGGGKSWLIRRIAERAFGSVQIIIIDPEGEFATLREKHGFVLVGKGGETPADPRSAGLVARRLLELNASAVCDIYELRPPDRHRWVRLFLEAMVDAPKELWHPVLVIVDEAHVFCPEKGQGESEAATAMIDLATRGRKRGFAPLYATQRLGKLSKNAAAELLNIMVGQTFIDIDQHRAAEALGIPRAQEREFFAQMKVIEPGHFWCLGRAISKDRILVKVGPVATTHPEPGSSKHAAAPPPPPSKIKHLLPKLADLPKEAEEKAQGEAALRMEIRALKAQLSSKPVPAPLQAKPSAPVIRDRIVEVPALKKGEIKELNKLVQRMEKARSTLGWTTQSLEIAANAVALALGQSSEAVERVKRKPEPVSVQPRPQVQKPAQNSDRPEFELLAGERKMLEVLAQFNPGTRTRSQLGALAGYTPSGGTFGNYYGRLKRFGLIKEDILGAVLITEVGLGWFGSDRPQAPGTTDELLAMWRGKLLAGERKMLDAVVGRYPNPVSRQELGEETGYESTGGTFGNYLGTLRRNALVTVDKESVKASDAIFELGNT